MSFVSHRDGARLWHVEFRNVDLHETLWRYKDNFPTSKIATMYVNGFAVEPRVQDEIVVTLNEPVYDFGDNFEKAYAKILVLARRAHAIKKKVSA